MEEVLQAQEPAPARLPTAFIARWSRDQNDNETYTVLVNQPFSRTLSASFRAGHIDLNVKSDRFRFEAGGVGVTWQPSRIGYQFSFDIWGDIDILRNRDFNGVVLYQGDTWDWDIRAQHRIIDTKVEATLPDGTMLRGGDQTYSDALGGTLYYKPTPNWSFFTGATDYSYENSLDRANLLFELGLLTLDSVMLAAQYAQWNFNVGVDYRFGPRQLGFRYTVDQPIFDPLKARTYSMNFALPVTKWLRLDVQVGQRKNIEGTVDDAWYGVVSFITRL